MPKGALCAYAHYRTIIASCYQNWKFLSLENDNRIVKLLTGFFKREVKSALCFCSANSKSCWAPGCLLCKALLTTTARSLKAPHSTIHKCENCEGKICRKSTSQRQQPRTPPWSNRNQKPTSAGHSFSYRRNTIMYVGMSLGRPHIINSQNTDTASWTKIQKMQQNQ